MRKRDERDGGTIDAARETLAIEDRLDSNARETLRGHWYLRTLRCRRESSRWSDLLSDSP